MQQLAALVEGELPRLSLQTLPALLPLPLGVPMKKCCTPSCSSDGQAVHAGGLVASLGLGDSGSDPPAMLGQRSQTTIHGAEVVARCDSRFSSQHARDWLNPLHLVPQTPVRVAPHSLGKTARRR